MVIVTVQQIALVIKDVNVYCLSFWMQFRESLFLSILDSQWSKTNYLSGDHSLHLYNRGLEVFAGFIFHHDSCIVKKKIDDMTMK